VPGDLEAGLLCRQTVFARSALPCDRARRPNQFRTRNGVAEARQRRPSKDEKAGKSADPTDILPLITVWLQVRVLPGPRPSLAQRVKAAAPKPTWAKAGTSANYGSAGRSNQNIENNPMQSSKLVDALSDPAKTF
jgi:hypothetical protein